MKKMRQIITVFLILIISQKMFSQKTFFVNETKLLEATPGYLQAIKYTDSLKKVYVEEMKESQGRLNDKFNQLIKNYNIKEDASIEEIKSKLSDIDKSKFELLLEESKLIEKQAQNKDSEFQSIYRDKVGNLLEKANTLVKNYCKNNKIDILLKIDVFQSAIAYYDESKDITSELIKMIKK